jgi:hypothetical protein
MRSRYVPQLILRARSLEDVCLVEMKAAVSLPFPPFKLVDSQFFFEA